MKNESENKVATEYETHNEVESYNLEAFLVASSTFCRFFLIFFVIFLFILINNLRLFLLLSLDLIFLIFFFFKFTFTRRFVILVVSCTIKIAFQMPLRLIFTYCITSRCSKSFHQLRLILRNLTLILL